MRSKESVPEETRLLDSTILANEKLAKWRVWLSIGAIIVFSFLLRGFLLNSAPIGALIDEAHFGYIAYSLLETGKDEHGISWPLIFKGFGDQKLPLYGYSLLPVVKWFGLSNVTIRIPSLIAGTAIVLLMYAMVKRIFRSHLLAISMALITIISPWPFFLSRFGFESNLGLAFFCVGLWAMIVSVNDQRTRWPVITAISWALTWYSYIAFRPVTIILAAIFFGLQAWRQKAWKTLLVFAIPFVLLVAPLLLTKAASSNTARFNQVGILTDVGMTQTINEQRTFCDMKMPRQLCYVFWNKPFYIGSELLRRYWLVFSPEYLATTGEEGLTFLNVQGFGQMYVSLYPFFILGIVALLASQVKFVLPDRLRILLLSGLLLTPLPTILVGDPQKVRISPLLPFVFLTTIIGLAFTLKFFRNRLLQKIIFSCVILSTVGLSLFYFVDYFTYHSVKNDFHYQSYVPEMMRFVKEIDPNATVIIKPFFSDPLMFYAYYTKMDPRQYQQQAVLGPLEDSGFQHTVGLGRLKIQDDSLYNVACAAVATNTPTYFVSNTKEPDAEPLHVLRSQNGSLVYATIYDALTVGKRSSCKK